MPAKATLFNLKCEAVFEFGTLHRNSIYYNPHGNNILLLFYCLLIVFQCNNSNINNNVNVETIVKRIIVIYI